MKLITIIGARPQFIKSALISNEIKHNKNLSEIIIHTGQHYDVNMSKVFFDQLSIPKPSYNLNINQKKHGEMVGEMLIELERILIKEKPKGVLVYGDTNSTLAGSLAASKLNIPLFHVESGLRSNNKSMPEEINRIITDQISNLLFCPTKDSVKQLSEEGIQKGVIFSGDVMFDLFLKTINKLDKINSDPFVFATIHRPENTDNPTILNSIIKGIEKISKDKKVIFPLHPSTSKKIKDYKIKSTLNFISPLDYFQTIEYLISADLVITDSGGLQKEAFFAKTKCITIRKETEWKELIKADVNLLCNKSKDDIWEQYQLINEKKCDFSLQLFGNGKAAKIIVKNIQEYLTNDSN